ncbi:MAG: hypothetical protein KDA77_06545 [Planctomycetaceae bacterium]|nr:hypothetical protein [Planctomycetaceae bacterium]
MGIGDRLEIEYFNGPHLINDKETFAFILRNLNWPVPGNLVAREACQFGFPE